jgi:hypothetical protein
MADDDKAKAAPDQYLTAVDRTRTTAQWLIGAFAAVGAAMLAGLQLTGLGKLADGDLVLAIAGVVIAVAGVLLAILYCAQVLTPVQTRIDGLDTDRDIRTRLEGAPLLKGYASSASDLKAKFAQATQSYHTAWAAAGAETPGTEANKSALQVQTHLVSLSAVVDSALHFATWVKVNRAFGKAKVAITAGSVMALGGMLAFAYFTNREDSFSPGSADATPANLVSLSFNGSRQAAWKPVLGQTCDLSRVTAIIISTDKKAGETELVSLPTGGCLPRHFKLGKDGSVTFGIKDVSVPVALDATAP